uniref:ribosomal protein S4 n=1 Tax=Streptosarcina costaricana TaxID=2058783 RepID=UPI00286B00D5|nr:ribosomal protein S4 [Streptosarcina costaricana]WKT08947.1 ribosomal protein S4 [Streptosarcina costaricana]
MSRYRGPRLRVIRRLGPLPGLTSQVPKHEHLPGKNQEASKPKRSQYRVRLEEKQKLLYHYGISERQLLSYIQLARRTKGSTGQALLQVLEMRLDNTVFRLGMAPTVAGARQLVSHGHILVNQQRVDIPSYRCKPKDVIEVRDKGRTRSIVAERLLAPNISGSPNHLSIDASKCAGYVNQNVDREWVGLKVNELLVVEYYSRKA